MAMFPWAIIFVHDNKSTRNKIKNKKWEYIKLKSFYTIKEMTDKKKRQPTK